MNIPRLAAINRMPNYILYDGLVFWRIDEIAVVGNNDVHQLLVFTLAGFKSPSDITGHHQPLPPGRISAPRS
jgi:hypothetical protein